MLGTCSTCKRDCGCKPIAEATLCNLCGETCALNEDPLDLGGLIDARVSGGYFSTPGNGNGALDDMTTYTFSLCEFCLDWLFAQCQRQVKVINYDGDEKWASAEERLRADSWRQGRERTLAEIRRRADLRGAK
jgi:hypothetical protein